MQLTIGCDLTLKIITFVFPSTDFIRKSKFLKFVNKLMFPVPLEHIKYR